MTKTKTITQRIETLRVDALVRNYLKNNPSFRDDILPTLKAEFPWLLRRCGTEYDFFHFCEMHGIQVYFDPKISYGVRVLYQGESLIFLNDSLCGKRLRYVMFHELAHHLFHSPAYMQGSKTGPKPFTNHVRDKQHFEAELIATVAVYRSKVTDCLTAE